MYKSRDLHTTHQVTCLMEEREEFAGRDVPSLISQFWDTNDITCFCYDKRFNKAGGKIKGKNLEVDSVLNLFNSSVHEM